MHLCSYVLMLFALAGCSGKYEYQPVKPITVSDTDVVKVVRAAEDVLTSMHFTIEKADPNVGFVRTKPLPAAQFFEFWRDDNAGSFNSAEANLHSVRRIAELEITEQGDALLITCDVQTQRLSLPEQNVAGSAYAYRMFSRSESSVQKLRLNPKQQSRMAWVNLGSDTELADKILKRLRKRLGEPTEKKVEDQEPGSPR